MEDSNNQAAPEALATDNAAETTTQPDAAGSQALDQSTTTTNASIPAVPAFDPRTSYDALVKQLESVNKNYGSLRSEYTRRTQYEAQLKSQIDSIQKAFTEATRQEISPEEFMKSLQTQGVKAFDPLKQEWQKEIKSEYEKALESQQSEVASMKNDMAVMRREKDTANYPDFEKLKPVMAQLADSENCPVDWNQDINLVYDTLYKLARDLKAEESVKQAREIGRKEADTQAAKEASTAVATGGKTNTSGSDMRQMSAADMKKHFAKLGMVSD